MTKLNDQEFQFLIDAALDTNDKAMFEDIIKRQEEGMFLDFPKQTELKETLSFAAKEKQRFLKDLEIIFNAYKNKPGSHSVLEDLIEDVEHLVNSVDERLANKAQNEAGVMPLSLPLDFPPMPSIEYIAVSYETAMDEFEKHAFPGETLDAFVARYFFGDEQ